MRPVTPAPSGPASAVPCQLRAGDPDALARLFHHAAPRLQAYLRRTVGREDAIDDLSQEVFLGARRTASGLEPGRELLPWFFAIARNKVCDHFRSNRITPAEASLDSDAESPELPPAREEPQAECERREMAAKVRDAVWSLPEALRRVTVLRAWEGLSFAAIARVLGLTPPTARKRYSRAIAALRRGL